jgi:hypothetical protein
MKIAMLRVKNRMPRMGRLSAKNSATAGVTTTIRRTRMTKEINTTKWMVDSDGSTAKTSKLSLL